MGTLWRSRGLVAVGLTLVALALVWPASAGPRRVDAGHGLSVLVPPGAHLTHRRFTPCADPVERFSVVDGRAVVTLEERLEAEPGPPTWNGPLRGGPPVPMECCAIEGRPGWTLHFLDKGRSFYAYIYPGGGSPAPLLRVLDSLRAGRVRL